MVGLIHKEFKVPYIPLDKFIDPLKLNNSKEELDTYLKKQESKEVPELIGYKGPDWRSPKFMQRVYENLPLTTLFIQDFCNPKTPFNILWVPEDYNYMILHQDRSIKPVAPWESLIPEYKINLKESFRELLLEPEGFLIVDEIEKMNPKYNGLDFDYDSYLINNTGGSYKEKVFASYKLHLMLSESKTMFIYDNVKDVIYDIRGKACLFNAMDFHDSYANSWGYSIQFPMEPTGLVDDIKEYIGLI